MPSAFLHPSVPMADYVADRFDLPPTLSSSIAHRLLTRSPLHAWTAHAKLNPAWAPDDDRDFDLGVAMHAVLLEGKGLEILPFDNYRTKIAQTAREECRKIGAIPALKWQADAIKLMLKSARDAVELSPDLAGIPLEGLKAEHTAVWQEGETWCRCRPDWLAWDNDVIFSLKTTGKAEPETFMRGPLLAHSYDLQSAFELAAIKALTGKDAHYVYIVVETEPPYACSLISLSPEWREFAAAKFRKAVGLWSVALASGHWPAYGEHIYTMDLPPWMQAKFMEQHGYEPQPVHDDGRPLEEQMFEKGIMP